MRLPYPPAPIGVDDFASDDGPDLGGAAHDFLTAWARPSAPDPHLLANLARFVLPAAVLTAGFAVAIYTFLYTSVTNGFDDPTCGTGWSPSSSSTPT